MALAEPNLLAVLACPACSGPMLAARGGLCCSACGRSFSVSDGIPNLRCEPDEPGEVIRGFYSAAPFPGYPPQDSSSALRLRAARSEFARLLNQAIAPDALVLEVGCGTGQMCLFLGTGDRLVVGADLTRASLELGVAAARRFGVRRVRFVETDLRQPGLRPGAFDVVYCSGVLHHTPAPEASFHAIARLARPGGFIVVGVYNTYARIPHRLRRAVCRCSSGWRYWSRSQAARRAGSAARSRSTGSNGNPAEAGEPRDGPPQADAGSARRCCTARDDDPAGAGEPRERAERGRAGRACGAARPEQ